MDSTHLNSSDKLSRINYEADKIHNNLLTNYNLDLTLPCRKKRHNPAKNTIENVMDLLGIVVVLMEIVIVSTGM